MFPKFPNPNMRALPSGTECYNTAERNDPHVSTDDRATDALGAGSWSRFTDFIARATNRTETLVDAGFTTNRFYRVVTPRRP